MTRLRPARIVVAALIAALIAVAAEPAHAQLDPAAAQAAWNACRDSEMASPQQAGMAALVRMAHGAVPPLEYAGGIDMIRVALCQSEHLPFPDIEAARAFLQSTRAWIHAAKSVGTSLVIEWKAREEACDPLERQAHLRVQQAEDAIEKAKHDIGNLEATIARLDKTANGHASQAGIFLEQAKQRRRVVSCYGYGGTGSCTYAGDPYLEAKAEDERTQQRQDEASATKARADLAKSTATQTTMAGQKSAAELDIGRTRAAIVWSNKLRLLLSETQDRLDDYSSTLDRPRASVADVIQRSQALRQALRQMAMTIRLASGNDTCP